MKKTFILDEKKRTNSFPVIGDFILNSSKMAAISSLFMLQKITLGIEIERVLITRGLHS